MCKLPIMSQSVRVAYHVPKCTNYLSCPIIFKLPIMSQKEDIISLYITPGPTKIVTNHSKYNQIKPTQNLNSTSQPIFIISPKFQWIFMVSFTFESLKINLRYSFNNHISEIDCWRNLKGDAPIHNDTLQIFVWSMRNP